MAVADSSVLIALAKIGKFGLLREIFGVVMISPIVKIEVVDKGLSISAPDAGYVQQALAEGWLRVLRLQLVEKKLKKRLMDTTNLDPGEVESMALAKLRGMMLLVDDKEVRTVARALGVELLGSAGVLLESFKIGSLRLTELEEAVKNLAKVMWLSPDIIMDIMKRAREVKW